MPTLCSRELHTKHPLPCLHSLFCRGADLRKRSDF